MAAAGFEELLLETVGVGQAEHAVRSQVDTLVLILMPGSGDTVQAMKAGIMELADVYVVNKRDLPGAGNSRPRSADQALVRAPGDWQPPVIETSIKEPDTLVALSTAIDQHRAWLARDARQRDRTPAPATACACCSNDGSPRSLPHSTGRARDHAHHAVCARAGGPRAPCALRYPGRPHAARRQLAFVRMNVADERPRGALTVPLTRLAWQALALTCVALGLLGVVLPGLPTVPFLIAAAWAGGRGWPALERWLLRHPRFGPPIARWRDHGAAAAGQGAATVMLISAIVLVLSSLPSAADRLPSSWS